MKKLSVTFLVGFLATVLLFSCKSVDNNDPKSVTQAFFEKLAKQDADGAAKFATAESKQTLDIMKKGFEAAKKAPAVNDSMKVDPVEQFKNLVFEDAKINGDKATVTIGAKGNLGYSQQVNLVKENGVWKVDFSMASLMAMDDKNAKQNKIGKYAMGSDSTQMQEQAADSTTATPATPLVDSTKK